MACIFYNMPYVFLHTGKHPKIKWEKHPFYAFARNLRAYFIKRFALQYSFRAIYLPRITIQLCLQA